MSEITREKFFEVLKKFDTAILTTIQSDKQFHARPMAIGEIQEGGEIVFLTDQSSGKIKEIENDPHVLVTCQNGWKDTVVLRGAATVFRDAAAAKKIWKKSFQTWFPNGPEDPHIAMIRVRAEAGEYWDNSGVQGIKYMVKAVKAIATHTRPEPDTADEHGAVTFR